MDTQNLNRVPAFITKDGSEIREHEPLRLLCCCTPAYEHADTVLTEPEQKECAC